MKGKKAVIQIHSVVASSPMDFEYQGEYAYEQGTHLIVYTDYTGNTPTKCAIQANADAMLLHRVGVFGGDMLFEPLNPTSVKYTADMLETELVLYTHEYTMEVKKESLTLFLRYMLTDPQGMNAIHGEQRIAVTWEDNQEECEP